MMTISLHPIGVVSNSRKTISDDHWGDVVSQIQLVDSIPTESLLQIELFSHLEIIYFFDRLASETIVYSGRPRENPAYPEMGIFSQRKKDRPNHLGLCTVQLLGHVDRMIMVKGLDAIDGTPVLDIKPVFREYLPKGTVMQPSWATELMQHYW